MSEKILNVVIKLRRETEEFYDKVKDTFIPLKGEVCLVDSVNYGLRTKVGDGKTVWKDLPYKGLDVLKIYGESSDTSAIVNGQVYDTPEAAIEAAPAGSEVVIQNSLGEKTVTVDKELTINLNSAEIKNDEVTPMVVGINGKLTLKNGGLGSDKKDEGVLVVRGEVTLNNCNLTRTDINNLYYTGVNHGKMTVNSGVFSSPGTSQKGSSMFENGYQNYNSGNEKNGYVPGVNQQFPELIVNGGSFFNPFYIIKNDDGGKLTINDGKLYGTILHNGIEMTINGGHFTTTDGTYPLSIRNLSDDLNPAHTVINGGTFDGNCRTIIWNSGDKPLDIKVKGGKFIIAVDEQYIAEGYEQKLIDGWYIVTKKGE